MKLAKYISFIVVLISLVWACTNFSFEPVIVFLLSVVTLIGLEVKTHKSDNESEEILTELSKFYDLKMQLLNNYYNPKKETVDDFNTVYSKLMTKITSKYANLEDEFNQLINYTLPAKEKKKGAIVVDKKQGINEFQKNYKSFIRKIK